MIKQRPFCDQRPSMKTNVLLSRHKVGKRDAPTYPLPDDDYAYGSMRHDNYGVKDIFQNYARLNSFARRDEVDDFNAPPGTARRTKRTTSRSPSPKTAVKRDFIATNKAALEDGCVTAHEYDEYRKDHMIAVKPKVNENRFEDEVLHLKQRAMVHGIQYHIDNEMKKCLEYQYGRDAVEKARRAQERRVSRESSPRYQMSNAYSRRLLPTRATIGHSYKPEPQPTYADTFKIKRFRDIGRYAIDDKWDKPIPK